MKISFICLSAQLTFADLLLQAQLRVNRGDRKEGETGESVIPTRALRASRMVWGMEGKNEAEATS